MNFWRFAGLILMLAAFLVQCGEKKAPNVLMDIEGHELHKDRFLDRFTRSRVFRTQDQFTADMVKEYISKYFVEDFYFIAEGYTRKLDEDSAFIAELKKEKRKRLIQPNGPLYQQVMPDSITVTEPEIKRAYEKTQFEYKIADIWLTNPSIADSLYEVLMKGANFADIARAHSADRRSSIKGGEVPRHFTSLQLGDKLGPVVSDLSVNQISRPVQVNNAFHIIQLLDKRKVEQKPLAQMRDQLVKNIKRQKTNAFIQSYIDSLYDAYEVQVNSQFIDNILNAFVRESQLVYEIQEQKVPNDVAEAVFVNFNEGKWTVAEFIEKYNKAQGADRIFLKTEEDVQRFVRQTVVYDLMFLEALKLELDQTQKFTRAFEMVKEDKLQRYTKNQLIYSTIDIDMDDLRAYYDQHDGEWNDRSFDEVKGLVQSKLRTELIKNRRNAVLEDLQDRYSVTFNDTAIEQVVRELNNRKRDI
ncbi:MAG: hypothetical protein GF313_03480 [Caldithrix sp.]|nr:hypothetical protein [Caldithrix sp.]